MRTRTRTIPFGIETWEKSPAGELLCLTILELTAFTGTWCSVAMEPTKPYEPSIAEEVVLAVLYLG